MPRVCQVSTGRLSRFLGLLKSLVVFTQTRATTEETYEHASEIRCQLELAV